MKQYPYKKGIIVGDIHFGCHSNSNQWNDIIKDFFEKSLIPYVENNKDIDFIFFLGDIFDNRQSVSVLVMNTAYDMFKKISSKIPVHIILGNHDVYYKTKNDISSIKIIEDIPNVEVWYEPEVLKIGSKKCFYMPWRTDHKKDKECIQEYSSLHSDIDYMFCHTDFVNTKYNKYSKVEEGNSVEVVDSIKRVYAGHIHYTQQIKNVNFVGTPYELTRSDFKNEKGFWILDFDGNEEEKFVRNNISPKHIKVNFETIKNYPQEKVFSIINRNFVDIYYKENLEDKKEIRNFLEKYSSLPRRLEPIPISENTDIHSIKYEKSMSILESCKEHIKSLDYSEEIKDKLKSSVEKLYKLINSDESIKS